MTLHRGAEIRRNTGFELWYPLVPLPDTPPAQTVNDKPSAARPDGRQKSVRPGCSGEEGCAGQSLAVSAVARGAAPDKDQRAPGARAPVFVRGLRLRSDQGVVGPGFGALLGLGALTLNSPRISSARWRRRHFSAGFAVASSASICSSIRGSATASGLPRSVRQLGTPPTMTA
jgi:hypothetical protein